MSHTYDVTARQTTTDARSLRQGHPRGRGFSILSRLARGGDAPTAAPVQREVPQAAPREDRDEWTAPVLPFDRTEPAPRHRRDDADLAPARRSS